MSFKIGFVFLFLLVISGISLWGTADSQETNFSNQAVHLPSIYFLLLTSQSGILEHQQLTYSDYPANCLSCHADEADDMLNSTHYRWLGAAPDMVNGNGLVQGKLTNAFNSYCGNILGNWAVCGSCHAGLGLPPNDPPADVNNIDCLVCHSVTYATARTRLSDGSMGVQNPTDAMARNVGRPQRANCLKCHATAGGGDGVKRGDLSNALIANNNPQFDVHMNTGGNNLSCQRCHRFKNHRVIGKGSDLRPTDDLNRGAEVKCATCHARMADSGHDRAIINTHVARVACQSCHIPVYAKVATEKHRDWRTHHDGTDATTCSVVAPCPGHPHTVKDQQLIPEYRWWNRRSDNTLLYDDASLTYDVQRDTYPTSRPKGNISDGKLFPFKYKTAAQPKTVADDRLIALDTYVYLKGSGNVNEAVESGLENMVGYDASTPYEWIITDTFQLINHGVEPSDHALGCGACHDNTSRMDLQGELGYALKESQDVVCIQCHEYEELEGEKDGYRWIHDEHVHSDEDEGPFDCAWCHNFSRPERGLQTP